ncbi:hypothetical protein HZC34_02970 [Candidatus Saganbacteria bacterium]|nr:hypothetical protein [Candidatus Saganbacteria bacterium]
MKKSILVFCAIACFTFLMPIPCHAIKFPFLGGTIVSDLIVDAMSISLLDNADSIYVGTINSDRHIGIGNETSLYYPIGPNLNVGPHFIFDYNNLQALLPADCRALSSGSEPTQCSPIR